ncbi:LOW QUALITY PROTEIN: Adap_comp_sub domain-containing protein/F-box-like domain-containing protein/LRR_6 domain-containing protein [Cephalotus follicularis]|uniref:Adap_comp_sub domain-containing protein/F-box-like domain-containing protein/LRR_6 domain-containing protein n=2 Tax=rosids TaxID=71275 RepID=A0A1Q3B5S2_CEPFO|nr:LOW QUALITY PROTEIN: Adap_comp_sub domain-containing protein/F-box-like domain-containing protein/LRR_6 domain-containing protein [Cephalotus follicularis]
MRGHDRINTCLPDELILEIFHHVESKPSRDACSLVCKRWLDLERLSRTSLRIGASGTPDVSVKLLARRFVNVNSVHIDERLVISPPDHLGSRRGSAQSRPSYVKMQYVTENSGSGEGEVGPYCLSDQGLTAIGEGFRKLEKLSLIWCSNVSSLGLMSVAYYCRSLKSLDLQGCYVGDKGLAAVGNFCKHLEDLNLRFCEGLTDSGLVELTFGCGKSLKSLGVAACAKITDTSLEAVGSFCKFLQTLSLDSEFVHNKGILAVAKGCCLLKFLKLQCSNVSDEALIAVGTYCLCLEVALYSFQKCTDRGLCAIGKGCKNLKNLALSDCYLLSDKGLEAIASGCTELTHLEVNGCHNIGTLGLESIGRSCLRLTELSLLYCQRIGSHGLLEVGRGCKYLQALHLVDCSGMGDDAICSVARGCRNLKKLHIRRCYEIGNKGIVAIGENCKSLTDLSLRFCDRVGDEALVAIGRGCSLKHLNVSGCNQIGDTGILAIARGCPQLAYLDVSVLQHMGDVALAEVGERCPLLKEVVLSHCRQVTDVGLAHLVRNCKMLESCHIVYCQGITAAGVATVVSGCPNIKKVLVEKWKVSPRTKRRAGSIISYLNRTEHLLKLYKPNRKNRFKKQKEAMPVTCSIRALWILNNLDSVIFSRRFPVVEKRWRAACKAENENTGDDSVTYSMFPLLPTDYELATAFINRKKREGSARGFGIRLAQSTEGSDSWVDDPITRHIISLYIDKKEGENYLLWPLLLHLKGPYCILVLPLVEPRHLKAYETLCKRSDCGNAVGVDESLSSLLLDLPSITGACMVAHAIGDVITGEMVEPEVVVSATPSVGGLLDSLTGSMGISGISSRAKPVAAPVASSAPSSTALTGAAASDAPKIGSRLLDKDSLQSFICSAMPFGTPLDLNSSNAFAIKATGFSSLDLPPADVKQPAWKPYLHKGKQRLLFTIIETVHAALYDRDEIPDSISVSGQMNCRAELEGLPDVSFPLSGLSASHIEVISFHPSAQVPERGVDKQSVMFSPPLGNFVLMRYQAICGLGPPIKGFYQLSMVSEDEGAFLFKLNLMEGYKAPSTMEFCNVTMPFPRRRIMSFDGTPSIGTVSTTEHSVEWKIITSGRGLVGKSVEATFPGTVRFAPWQIQRLPSSRSGFGTIADEDSDTETESANSLVNVEEFLMEKMNKDLPPVDLEEPFCWQAYNYAKVSFKIVGAALSGISIDPKSVSIYPAVKAPVEFSSQVAAGDYILWNTLGKCPSAATPKV